MRTAETEELKMLIWPVFRRASCPRIGQGGLKPSTVSKR